MPETRCGIVVVGASAGGVEALLRFARACPGDFPVPILVVVHISAAGPSVLPQILTRAGALEAVHAEDGMEPSGGGFYIAPPDHHMRIRDGRIELDHGARENGHRPAIDPLFLSAADSHGPRAAGVILSGTLDDGTVGLFRIGEAGGTTLVQDPVDAAYPAMPANAIAYAQPDYVLTVEELVDTLVGLTAEPDGRPRRTQVSVPDVQAPAPSAEQAQRGTVVPFSCPDCGGTLWERGAGGTISFRCRVGHAFTMHTLAARHVDGLERTLWSAYRALEERAALSRRIARQLADRGRDDSSKRFTRQAEAAARQAAELKVLLDTLEAAPDVGLEPVAEPRG